MYLSKKLKRLVLVCVFACISSSLSAHVLNDTSAQVVLRDGQVEVRLITDIDHLIAALQNNQAWLMGDIDEVMPADLSVSQQEAFIEKALVQHMTLIVNEQTLSFDRVAFANQHDGENRGVSGEIIFQTQHAFAEVSKLSISFHKSLGAVHVSLVKPQYEVISAGEQVDFVL